MKKTLTAKAYLPILLIAVLVLLTPVYVAQADIGLWLYNNLVLAGFGKILGWAGLILDYAINTFVIGFGTQMSTNLGVVVNNTWATVRDLFNLTFIFGLVYIGFKMILRTDDSNSRKWLINLIIAALLVNFSLFITKFVIDFSNILAVEVINLGITEDVFDSTGGFVQISTSMQNSIGVVTTAGEVEGADAAEGEITMSMVLGTIMIFLVAAFVYFSAGILLIVRAAVLIVLMILSPFLFIGMVLPMFKNTATQLWSTLFKRAFLAPIYIIFLYLSLKLSEDIFTGSFAGMFSSTDGSDVLTGATTAFGPFILVVALLLMSLTAAQKMGAEGAGAMISMGHKMRQRGQKMVAAVPRRGAVAASGAASKTARRLNTKLVTSNSLAAKMTRGGLATVGLTAANREAIIDKGKTAKFGGKKSADDYEKDTKKREKDRLKAAEQNPYDENGEDTKEFAERLGADDQLGKLNTEQQAAKDDKAVAEKQLATADQNLKNALAANQTIKALQLKLDSTQDLNERSQIESEIKTEEDKVRSDPSLNSRALTDRIGRADATIGSTEKAIKSRRETLAGEHKYANVKPLREQRQKEQKRWGSKLATAGSVGGGAAAGAAIGSVVPVVGTLAGAIVGAAAGLATQKSAKQTTTTRLSAITEEYGRDGDKKIKDKGKNDILKSLQEQIAEADSGSDSSPASTESSEEKT